MASESNSDQELERWEKRAPGWRMRCLTCGFSEPWGKHGIRLAAVGKKYTLCYCPRCRWLRCVVVEKKRDRT